MEEKSIVTDAVESTEAEMPAEESVSAPEPTASEPSGAKVTDSAATESTPEKSESLKSDLSARLREAKETITRASYDAEATADLIWQRVLEVWEN